MTYFADLSRYQGGQFKGEHAVAIGWLAPAHPFETGSVAASFVAGLKELERWAWVPIVCMGIHSCKLGPANTRSGAQTLWIPGESCVFVSPDLIRT